jgi:hypothetical protein
MRAFLGCLAVLLFMPGCGGSPSGATPSSADKEPHRSAPSGAAAHDSAADAASEGTDERESSPGPRCDDGTCSACGNGICPAGWYCDEKAGGACSWLAECASKPSCGCITRVLGAACKCDSAGGGLKVACD